MLGIAKSLPDAEELERDLRAGFSGEVHLDRMTRGLYATDASIYQIEPVAVVLPRTRDDVAHALGVALRRSLKVLPRGGGTSLAGQTVGASLVIDFSKHMNRVLEVNEAERWARIEPGIVRDELNSRIAATGLHFAPETATASRANVGGMIGNNSSGTRSILYGKTIDHVLELTVLLADGTEMKLAPETRDEWMAAEARDDAGARLRRGVRAIVERERDEILVRYPKVMRRVGGYNLDEFVLHDFSKPDERWNLAWLACGSEGTLCTTVEAKVRLEPLPRAKTLGVIHYKRVDEGLRSAREIVKHGPTMVEMLDRTCLDLAKRNIETRRYTDWVKGDPALVLCVEFFGDTMEEAEGRLHALYAEMEAAGVGYARLTLDAKSQSDVMNVRLKGLGLMLGMKGDLKPIPFIEDAAVPVEVLPDYIADVIRVIQEEGATHAMYAHASVGLIHVRPILDLKTLEGVERMKRISERVFELVKKYGGAWSGEHGDGLVRSYKNREFFGDRLYDAFREIKRAFDPEGRMNPGKIVEAPPMDENLRMGPQYRRAPFATQFFYREDGGFDRAVELCTGVGECRKTLGGTMCPSYRATRDEVHSTRGRANALRLAMTGQLGLDGMTAPDLHDALDLCLGCKACKAECPSNVDMAKLKCEHLSLEHDARGATRGEMFFANAPLWGERFAGPIMAPIVNAAGRVEWVRKLMARVLGLDPKRPLPEFASEPFVKWFDRHKLTRTNGSHAGGAGGGNGSGASGGNGADAGPRRRVALFDDTFVRYHEPSLGRAAVALLEALGYEVELARAGCCCRTLISHGFLREARRTGGLTLRELNKWALQETPILVLEPSCLSSLTDDLPDLLDNAQLGRRVAKWTMSVEQFLKQELDEGRLDPARLSGAGGGARAVSPVLPAGAPAGPRFLVHGHCHQKALHGTAAMKDLLAKVPGAKVEEIPSGCCGMAGSFGYAEKHREVSFKVGEDRLFPAVRAMAPGTDLVACGFSCRHQIADACGGAKARHWVEAMAEAIGAG